MNLIRNKAIIYVKESLAVGGLGVFADKEIAKNSLIEICPLILLPTSDLKYIKKTKLNYYYFEYNEDYFNIMLGYGSIYNHSYTPNAKYSFNYKDKIIKIFSIKNIKKDEEIFINYNYYVNDKTPLENWFDKDFKDKSKS